MNKLQLSLSVTDVRILASIIGHMLTGTDVKELKSERKVDYLLFSCIHEFFNKLDAKNKEVAAFGSAPGKLIKLTLKRHEGLAFFFLTDESDPEADSYLPALPDVTMNLIREIRGLIHKQFLI